MKSALKELRGKAKAKREELKTIFDEAGEDMDMSKVKSIDGDSTAKVEHIRSLNKELDEIVEEMEPMEAEEADLQKARRRADELGELDDHPGHQPQGGGKGNEEPPTKSFGEHFIESDAYKNKGELDELDIELKTLLDTTTGWVPETTRGPRVVDFATTPLDVVDLLPTTTTGQTSVVYMEETTYTNAAAETAEGVAKPEAALALTEKSSPVRKIAVWIPVTDEQLEDVPQVRGYLNNRLPFMVRQRLNTQILTGNGTAPNLRGLLNTANIQTQATGTDPVPDAVYKAMVKIQTVGQAQPGGVVFNPLDWQDVRLLRTADGIYIWGSPADPGPQRIWGLPVALAQGLTQNTALVGDFANFTELAIKKGVEVQIRDTHGTFFVENKQAVRAEMRAAIVVYRPQALCTVTGV